MPSHSSFSSRHDTHTPAPRLTRFLKVLKFEEGEHPRNPGGETGGGRFRSKTTSSSPDFLQLHGDKDKFKELKAQWAHVNDELLPLIDKPDSPEATEKIDKLKGIVKQMYRLNADPGGVEGIGYPGGPRDVVIVGAGPGGLAASVMGGTDGLDTLLIDGQPTVGGQAKHSSRVENFLGFPAGASGTDLAKRWHEQALRVGADVKLGVKVESISYDPDSELKTLKLSNGETVTSRAVILAGGVDFKTMDFPGAKSHSVIYGDSKNVVAQGVKKHVVIVGGSNGAAQAALAAAKVADQVSVLSRSPISKAMSDYQVQALTNHPKINVIEGDEIAGLATDAQGNATVMTTKNGKRIDAHILGMFVGGGPNTKWLPSDIKLSKDGKVAVDGNLETSMPGVYAIGDMRQGSIGRIGTAAADGQMAEHNLFEYFQREPAPKPTPTKGFPLYGE